MGLRSCERYQRLMVLVMVIWFLALLTTKISRPTATNNNNDAPLVSEELKQYPLINAPDVDWQTGRRNCYDSKSQRDPGKHQFILMLTKRAPAPYWNHTKFPCVHMTEPKVDTWVNYYGNKEISHMLEITNFVLKNQPSWRNATIFEIRALLTDSSNAMIRSGIINMDVALKSGELLLNIRPMDHPWKIGEIQHSLEILSQKNFPSEKRPMTCRNCFPYNFKNIISPSRICANNDKVGTILVVTTIPNNIKERVTIRQTWARSELKLKYNFEVIFLFGAGWPEDQVEKLQTESYVYKDILMDNFHDNYYNLTQKVLMGYHWILNNCRHVKWIVRAADDTWIDIPAFFGLISDHGSDEAFQRHQVGDCFAAFKPYRRPDYKGFLSTYEYDLDVFPPYALGTVFLTSRQLTQDLVKASPNIPYICIEDSYFGLVLAHLGRGCFHVRGMVGRFTTHALKPTM